MKRKRKLFLIALCIILIAGLFLFTKRSEPSMTESDPSPARTKTRPPVDTETFLNGMRTAGCQVSLLSPLDLEKAMVKDAVAAYRITGGEGCGTLAAHLWIYPNRHVAAEAFSIFAAVSSVPEEDCFATLPQGDNREKMVFFSGDVVLVANTDVVRKNRVITLIEENGFVLSSEKSK